MIRKARVSTAPAVLGVLAFGAIVWISAGGIGQREGSERAQPLHADQTVGGAPRADRPELSDDPDKHFLQDVLDHEEAMLAVTRTLLQRDLADSVRERVFGLDVEHAATAERAAQMLRTSHSIEWKPAVRPGNDGPIRRALAGQPTDAAVRLYEFVRWHKRQEVALADSFLPLLTRAEVILMARQMGTLRGSKTPLMRRF